MAVLKDLIVHGPSRFINGIDADSVHANLIDANDGIFKTITTTTLDAETITTDMLTAQNARVAQTLTVDGTISTNKWEAANIANIGGNFYISPTGKADSGTITVTKTGSTTVNGVSVGVYTLVVGSASFGVTSTSSTIWGAQSKVIFTGSIAYNSSKKYPLGTCNGTMTSVSTGSGTLTGFTITGVNSPALDIFFKEQGVTSVSNTACTGYEMQISVYQSYYSSALHPIGILLTSYGKDKKQYIDIYGGANTLGDSASGFANPSVRIGQLDGLPNIVDGSTDSATAPTGWGIYTDNGFFKGKIVSNAGKIGGFTIGATNLYNSKTSLTGSTAGIFISTTGIAGGAGNSWWIKSDGTFQFGGTSGVRYDGSTLTVPAANVSGELTAATISGSKITANTITAGQIASNAITADKLDATTINASKKLTVGAMTDAAANSILNSNLEIGGRNLFRYTSLTDIMSNKWIKNGTVACSANGDKLTITGAGEVFPYSNYYTPYVIPTGTTVTLSCYFYENTVSDGNRYIYYAVTPGWRNKRVPANYVGLWQETFTLTEELTVLCPEYDLRNSTGGQWVVSPLKLEIGNKATDWSPAPEDLDVHKYVTDIDSNGIWVTPYGKKPTNTSTGAGATGTKIDGTGLGIYVGGTKLAQYGTTTYFYEPDGTTAATLDGTGLNIKTGTITLGNNFSVTSAGVLNASGATIQGDVTVSKLTVSSGATISDDGGLISNEGPNGEIEGLLNTTNGLTSQVTQLDSDLEDLTKENGIIQQLQEQIGNGATNAELQALSDEMHNYLGTAGYMLIDDQALVITKQGTTDNFAVIIRGDQIQFTQNGNLVAYIKSDKLFIEQSEVLTSMKVGNFEWKIRDGRLTLMYTGGSN